MAGRLTHGNGNCFVAGTQVVIAEFDAYGAFVQYVSVNIEEIQVGDMVLARSEDYPDGELVACEVINTFVRDDQEVATVTLTNLATNATLEITGTLEHPFYVRDKGFVPLGELAVDDVCITPDGTELTVTSIIIHEELQTVYNFTVDGSHTYFVGLGFDGAVLVHNEDDVDAKIKTLTGAIKAAFELKPGERLGKKITDYVTGRAKEEDDWLEKAEFKAIKRKGGGPIAMAEAWLTKHKAGFNAGINKLFNAEWFDPTDTTEFVPTKQEAEKLVLAVTASDLAYTGAEKDGFVALKKWGFDANDPNDEYVKSGLKAVLYEHTKDNGDNTTTKTIVLAFAGTDTEFNDWYTNLIQPFDPLQVALNSQYGQVKGIVLEAKNERENIDIITGHSLGGGLATLAKLYYGDGPELYIFNPAYLNSLTVAKFGNLGDFEAKAHVWHVVGCPVTIAQAIPAGNMLYNFSNHYYITVTIPVNVNLNFGPYNFGPNQKFNKPADLNPLQRHSLGAFKKFFNDLLK